MEQKQLRKALLVCRQKIAQFPKGFKNTTLRNRYVKILDKKGLTWFQKQYVVGLMLSDAGLDRTGNSLTARIKIQQNDKHLPWLRLIRTILLEYTTKKDDSFTQITRKNQQNSIMFELDTLKCKTFRNFLDPIFYNQNGKKTIDANKIKDYITPVSVAAWYCGDGGKTTNDDFKGITLNSQGFTKEENESLALILKEKLNIETSVCETTKHGKIQYSILISGSSFDLFIEQIGPYIPKCFDYKVQTGRAEGSIHGSMTETRRNEILGSALPNLENLIVEDKENHKEPTQSD